MRGGNYNNPVYAYETHYGFWWLLGMLFVLALRVVVWAVVLLSVLLVCLVMLIFKPKHLAKHRLNPRNPRLFYSDRR